ncbi:TPA: hypothetical protein UDO24_002064 [Streptococcus suis]|uniref:Uncharacterized protein n=1 Tax=Streptococcus suis TaxID=1307 RepID=A0A426G8K7_STRSU|nr:hypothetical protein [Streptococcus suis]RRN51166.1 hypothetical protein EI220_05225 [Streptococcus suis]RRR47814.1 hypothetical protein EJA00_07085 [Streptococcus suis]HEL1582939.1 hypothetical protein [Streptococcus suis]HEL2734696.1 hypothetical protein [Streptococcus suis]HEL2737092.1 hypothetical protein [Streptococcus suis]
MEMTGQEPTKLQVALDNLDEALETASYEELVAAGLAKPKGFWHGVKAVFYYIFRAILFCIQVPIFLYYFIKHWILMGIGTFIAYSFIYIAWTTFTTQTYNASRDIYSEIMTDKTLYIVIPLSGFLALLATIAQFREWKEERN